MKAVTLVEALNPWVLGAHAVPFKGGEWCF